MSEPLNEFLNDIDVSLFSFAFRFLVESYKMIRDLSHGQHLSLLTRIKETCMGHLKWLHSIWQNDGGRCFRANYWVSGKPMIQPELSISWIAEESLLDTAFQILKAAACIELWDENEKDKGAQFAAELMSDWAPAWLASMQNSDKRKKYAWPHSKNEGVNTFRLDDHVWIWRALRALENHNYRAWKFMSRKVCAERILSSIEFGLPNGPFIHTDKE